MLNLDSRDVFIILIVATFPVFAFMQDMVSVLPIIFGVTALCFLEFVSKRKASEFGDLRAEMNEIRHQIDALKETHEAFKLRVLTGGKK